MTKIIMNGCHGAMGNCISQIVKEDEQAVIVAGIDAYDNGTKDYPVFTNIDECNVDADVMIDFSTASAVDRMLDYVTLHKLPVVLCTTGLSDAQLKRIQETSKSIPILRSANMSLGINTLIKLVSEAAKILAGEGFDVEIIEKHHNQKLDAPSGTALALADAVNEAMGNPYEYVYDRSTKREKRDKKELGISSVRGGTIVGEHDVLFAGIDEVVTFSHTAYSKAVFAKGAVAASKFLAGKQPGLYDMKQVV